MIDHIDHIVLTTRDKEACIRFYTEVLGMKLERFRTPTEERLALKFGSQKINLHEWGREFEPRAHVAVPGSLDLCFIAAVPLERVIARLNELNVQIIEGPVPKTGRRVEAALGLRARPRPEPRRDLRTGVVKLIIATPSPFARKARIALIEKQLAHEIEVQNPWQSDIAANPLGKVPALLLDDGRVVHDSSVIIEYLETLFASDADSEGPERCACSTARSRPWPTASAMRWC